MYIPKYYKNNNITEVKEFIDANGFAILVSQVDGRPWATHIPLILDKNEHGKDVLMGHISKANKQWREFERNKEVLAIFSGPDAYISSSWYDHENVPTWNYLAIHVYGRIQIIEGDLLKKHLSKLVDKYETGMVKPVSVDKMSTGFLEKEIKGIVGFEIEISDIQAAFKLSQNRDDFNQARIMHELKQKGDPESLEIARLMKNERKSH
jgi:transcriptional regulator